MPQTIVAHEQPISSIFSDGYAFNIPSYQRPYAWTTDQALELFEDLISFMRDSGGNVVDMPPYFLGSIVLIKQEAVPQSDVVDGQQRLTTITILLSAIRESVDVDTAKDITSFIYEKGNSVKGTLDHYRLKLRERDAEFFRKYVQIENGLNGLLQINTELPDSQRNIRDNARLFVDQLKKLDESERAALARFIVTRCFLVVVATPDLDSAYRIFSVLNSRGLELSATDILKAEIVGGVPQSSRDEYNKKWEDAEEDLGRESFSELFSHIRMIYRKAKPQATLLKEFKEHVTEAQAPIKFIDDVLLPAASAYEEISDASYSSTELAEQVNVHLGWLNRLNFKDWMPPAIAFVTHYRNQPARMLNFFRDLERLGYFMLITKAGVNARIDRFSKLTADVERGNDLSVSDSSLQLTPYEQYAMYAALAGPIYESLSARARSTVLLRLDALLSGGGAQYDYSIVTVEHVLPQTVDPTSQWAKWFPEVRDRLSRVHTLGNLALLSRRKNSAASNYDFDRKKNAYFARGGVSPFVLTTEVLQDPEWTPAVVDARQKKHLATLEAYWRLENRKNLLDELGAL
ncbi:MAG: DUF262 domain-containing HNH endonuclease family protein [Acidihalobacter sp.]|uniref:DUF262 domain-containing protein n=1 Tax=Acidihalobacter sp. TaxID=1872108 RepID=UPI00307F1553